MTPNANVAIYRLGLSLACLGMALGVAACGDTPSSPSVNAVAARGSASTDPTVTSVSPVDAPRNITLDLTVNGSGFDRGTVVDLEAGNVPASGITTNATRFVNSKQLVANITIAADAVPERYDVAVTTTNGKRGIGVERFEVLSVLDLGTLNGAQLFWGDGINNQGHVIGTAYPSSFFWSASGGAEALQPGLYNTDYGINDADEVVGTTCGLPPPTDPLAPSCTYYGVLWRRTAAGSWAVTRITGDRGTAMDINNLGQIVGNDPGPTLWTPAGSGFTRQALPIPPGRASISIRDINNSGQATGGDVLWSLEAGGAITTTLLPAPVGTSSPFGSHLSDVYGSDELVVVGSTDLRGHRQPVRWWLRRQNGVWKVSRVESLASPNKTTTSNGLALWVNATGDAVGYVFSVAGVAQPVRWWANGTAVVLEHPKGRHSQAKAINDQGWITGYVSFGNEGNHALIWRQ